MEKVFVSFFEKKSNDFQFEIKQKRPSQLYFEVTPKSWTG